MQEELLKEPAFEKSAFTQKYTRKLDVLETSLAKNIENDIAP